MVVWIFTVIKLSLKDSTAPWLNDCLDSLSEDKRSTEWVARLPAVISALNKEVTRLTGQKPVDAIKKKLFHPNPQHLI